MTDAETNLTQRTKTWHEWRLGGIGASEVSALLHLIPDQSKYASPWQTPYPLWEVKTGRSEGFQGNWATERGNLLEAPARAWFELWMMNEFGEILDFEPRTLTHPDLEIARCSLDGFCEAKNAVLEIKCPGAKDHETAKQGFIPDKYYAQVQYQLAISKADLAYYFSYDGKEGAVVKVYPDKNFQQLLFDVAQYFWTKYVVRDLPPPFVALDTKKIRDREAVALCESFKKASEELARAENAFKLAKAFYDDLKIKVEKRFAKYTRAECGPMVWTRERTEFKQPKGEAIDVDQAPEEQSRRSSEEDSRDLG